MIEHLVLVLDAAGFRDMASRSCARVSSKIIMVHQAVDVPAHFGRLKVSCSRFKDAFSESSSRMEAVMLES